jgi:NADH-quinone oxidoreductase subunit G
MVTIYIDDKPFQVKDGQNLLQACLSLGFDLPYFCWHPAMGSVGACRQCAVKQYRDETDKQGQIVLACMTPVGDGTRISIQDPEAVAFRAGVIEWMMINHPHDCPVCDEGGECHLQDMTVMTGHTRREYRFKKRTHRNQYLGPFINHEMNRCIHCYRCVRFYRDYAGGRDFNVFGCHDHVYFGRHHEGTLENPFSGNLVEICPTGVFTDKTFKEHSSRKWDLQTAPSVCIHCGLGCNTIAGERYGQLRRIRNRYHHHINGYFLCDRGRYGYEFANSEHRILQPLQRNRRQDRLKPISRETALASAAALLAAARGIIGIGSPRASLEANFMLRELVGVKRFYAGISNADRQLIQTAVAAFQKQTIRVPSLLEAGHSDVVFVLGEDVSKTAPLLALNLRQLVHRKAAQTAKRLQIPDWNDAGIREVVQHEKEMLFVATPQATGLDDVAMTTHRAAPADLARLGFSVAAAIDASAPTPADLTAAERALAENIARGLKDAQRPLIVSGTGCGDPAVMQAAFNVACTLGSRDRPAELLYAVPECNSLGLGVMGAAGGIEAAVESLEGGNADTVVILENDLFRRVEAQWAERLVNTARGLIVLDHLRNRSVERADLVLPAATFAEATGTLVNYEGRAQRYFKVFPAPAGVEDSWRWLRDLATGSGRFRAAEWHTFDDVVSAMAAALPVFTGLPETTPGADFRMIGGRIPRQSHRYSGRTAMRANIDVHEPKPPEDPDSPLSFSMEGHDGPPPSALISRYWSPGWNSVQALNKFQSEIPGPLRGGDPGERLMDRLEKTDAAYFTEIPSRASLPENRWWMVAVYHIFGSEELSILSPAIAQRMPAPYVALNPADAALLETADGDPVTIILDDRSFDLPARSMQGLARRVAGLPAGLPGIPVLKLPALVTLRKGSHP